MARRSPRSLTIFKGLAVVLAVGFAYLAYVYLTLPDVRALAEHNPDTTAFMELRKAEAEAGGKDLQIRQRWVPYSRISPNLRRAVLVAEDDAFFDHEGIDLKQLRASLEATLEDGQELRGGSTITQQLAKNLYLSPSRNPVRKFKELLIARRLETALTKRRILELYLNVIEWGDGIFGCEAAARAYFGKPAAALTTDEAALMAGAIINPRIHSPARPTRRLLRRQQIILRRMNVRKVTSAAPAAPPSPAPAGDAAPAQTVQSTPTDGLAPPDPSSPGGSFAAGEAGLSPAHPKEGSDSWKALARSAAP
ncbi:MAG: monofunctional biosynthetic peptidoglycan transglycosylase [Vicinamibacterales bacterium]